MTRLTKRIHADLSEIAARATPSPDAWVHIRQRIASEGDNHQMEAVMLDTEDPKTSRGHRPVALAAAAAVLIVVLAATLLAADDSSDDKLGVAGRTDADQDELPDDAGGSNADAQVRITVDGRTYVLTELESCYHGPEDPTTDAPLVHVIGRTEEGSRVELGLNHERDPIDPADTAGYTGRLSIHEGAVASSWRPDVAPALWPGLSIGSTGVSGEVTMTDRAGDAVEVAMSISCGS